MASPDAGPLLEEQLDELELIVLAGENGGRFPNKQSRVESLIYILGWHDRNDRKLLEAARWALAQGWQRGD